MAEGTSAPFKGDMLDIIFADRNKAYGAYQLRRSYPQYLRRALLYALGLIVLFFALPYILNVVSGVFSKVEEMTEVEAKLGPPPDIAPPPPPPPPVETPPPPTRSTQKYVPPIVEEDEKVTEEKPVDVKTLDPDKDIATTTQQGDDDALPAPIDNPSLDPVIDPPPVVEDKTYEMFDIQKSPSFPGGEAELLKYLNQNIKYPQLARDNNIQGSVALTFVVNKDGSVSDVKILKDIGGGCGKEAVRVVNSMPRWIPGEANGHPVKVRFTLPVRFRLE